MRFSAWPFLYLYLALNSGPAPADRLAAIFLLPAAAARSGPSPSPRANRTTKQIRIEVTNPGCAACLRTLKGYLLKMTAVKAVKLTPARGLPKSASGNILITVDYIAPLDQEDILARVRLHDLNIVSFSPAPLAVRGQRPSSLKSDKAPTP